jgi:hypothetical protein
VADYKQSGLLVRLIIFINIIVFNRFYNYKKLVKLFWGGKGVLRLANKLLLASTPGLCLLSKL